MYEWRNSNSISNFPVKLVIRSTVSVYFGSISFSNFCKEMDRTVGNSNKSEENSYFRKSYVTGRNWKFPKWHFKGRASHMFCDHRSRKPDKPNEFFHDFSKKITFSFNFHEKRVENLLKFALVSRESGKSGLKKVLVWK